MAISWAICVGSALVAIGAFSEAREKKVLGHYVWIGGIFTIIAIGALLVAIS